MSGIEVISFNSDEEMSDFFDKQRKAARESAARANDVQRSAYPGTMVILYSPYSTVYGYLYEKDEMIANERSYYNLENEEEREEFEWVEQSINERFAERDSFGYLEGVWSAITHMGIVEIGSQHVSQVAAVIGPVEFWAGVIRNGDFDRMVKTLGPGIMEKKFGNLDFDTLKEMVSKAENNE